MTACYRLLSAIFLLIGCLAFRAPAQIAWLPATLEVRTVQGFAVPFQNGMPVPIFEKQRRPTVDLKGVWRKQRFTPNQAVSLGLRDSAGMAALEAEKKPSSRCAMSADMSTSLKVVSMVYVADAI